VAALNRDALAALAVGVALLLLASTGAHLYTIDGLQYYRVADALLTAGSLRLEPPIVWGTPIETPITPIGYSLVLLPAIVLALSLRDGRPPLSGDPYDMALLYGDPMVGAISWVNPVLTGLLAAATAILITRVGLGGRWAIGGTAVAVFAGPLFFYGRSDLTQTLSTLLLVAALIMALDVRRGVARPTALALVLALGLLTRPLDGALAIGIVGLTILVPPSATPRQLLRRGLAGVVAGALVGALGHGLVNLARWGDPFEFNYGGSFRGTVPDMLAAELLSPGRGLLWYMPVALLAIPGIVVLARSGRRPAAIAMAATIVAFVGAYAAWQGLGGWTWGPRYLTPVTPLLGILAVAVAASSIRWRLAYVVAAVGGIGVNFSHLLVDQLRHVWPVYGDSVVGTPGFDLQFTLGAFAPIASWRLGTVGPDIVWIREAAATGGWSLIAGGTILALGVLALATAWRQAAAGPAIDDRRSNLAVAEDAEPSRAARLGRR
jgi:hypothetical protein